MVSGATCGQNRNYDIGCSNLRLQTGRQRRTERQWRHLWSRQESQIRDDWNLISLNPRCRHFDESTTFASGSTGAHDLRGDERWRPLRCAERGGRTRPRELRAAVGGASRSLSPPPDRHQVLAIRAVLAPRWRVAPPGGHPATRPRGALARAEPESANRSMSSRVKLLHVFCFRFVKKLICRLIFLWRNHKKCYK